MHDIRPLQRNVDWRKLSIKVMTEYLSSLMKFKTHQRLSTIEVEQLMRKPIFKNDSIIKLKYTEMLQKQMSLCEIEKGQCSYISKAYINISGSFVDLDYQFLEKHYAKYPELTILIDSIIGNKDSDLFCRKPFMQNEVAKRIDHSFSNFFLNKNLLENNLIPKKCLKSMKAYLISIILTEKSNDKKIEFYLSILIRQNLLKQKEEDLLLTFYLLGNPVKGDLLNRSWGRVEKLARNYKRRKAVLNSLLSIDPLPDRIFQIPSTKKRNAIMAHFNKHFPEYLNSYARTCVNFYEGNEVFENGNPTIYCDKFFEITKSEKKWVSDSIRLRHSSAKKIQYK